ncbi:MAG TPA: NAD-dependent epimerase/dehydratase family protein [Chitinophagales bacterium]|nr:NAD-dependent epimerase/dehydratase family protein [Chitinophagales bacterium]
MHSQEVKKPIDKLNILVTGGAGFLGSTIVNELLDPNVPLRVQSVTILGLKDNPGFSDGRVRYIQGDICNPGAINKACEGIDLVIHTAAIVDWGTKSPREVYRVNVEGTKNIIAACRQNNVSMLIYTSSLDVVMTGKPLVNIDETQPYAVNHLNMYCESKCLAEQLVLSANSAQLKTCALRPADIWGERDPYHIPPLIQMAKSGFYTRIGNGRALSQHVYSGNMAWAHVLAAKALAEGNKEVQGKAYFITDSTGSNFFSFFDEIILKSGYKIRPKNLWLPKGFAYFLGTVSEYIAFVVRPFKYYTPKFSRFAVTYTCTDFTFTAEKARKDFAFVPKYSKEEAMERTVGFFRRSTKND